jgi:hypothetical protein
MVSFKEKPLRGGSSYRQAKKFSGSAKRKVLADGCNTVTAE